MIDAEIIIGSDANNPLYKFSRGKQHIKGISGVMSSSMAGDALSIDKITFTVDLEYYRDTLYSPTDADAYQDTNDELYAVRGDAYEASERLRALPNATPVRVYHDGELFGKFYSGEVKRLGPAQFSVTASSAMQLLEDATDHMGGLYAGITFIDLLIEIIGGTRGTAVNGVIPVTGGIVDFYVSSAVAALRVYGWLPKATPRDNIHQMLFAHSVNIMKGTDGDILFDYLTSIGAVDLPDGRIFLSGSVTYTPPATRVELTEHTYVALPTDEETVLMNNTSGGVPSDETTVIFSGGPVHGLSTEGELTILESGVNYARIRGVGILKGKRYHHTTTLLTTESAGSGAEKTVASDACTLISPLNGGAVLERLISYYLSARSLQADIDIGTERPGSLLRFKSVFGETETAFLATMNYKLTSFVRATCTLIAGYDPSNAGNEYAHVDLIIVSGTYIVKPGVTKIMVVCIGGGTGGGSGGDGGQSPLIPNAEHNYSPTNTFEAKDAKPGSGGAPGTPGIGGRIYRATLQVTPGQRFSALIGRGGEGAPVGSFVGSEGGATTFGSVSSASGYANAMGFTDLISGNTYAATGENGISGSDGDGPNGTSDIVVDGVRYTHGNRGSGASDSKSQTAGGGHYAKGEYFTSGGYGGGPAYKANGGKGKNGSGKMEITASYYPPVLGGDYGDIGIGAAVVAGFLAVGGDGANAQAPPDATTPGSGGTGGNGGGGVGAFGAPANASAEASTAAEAKVFYAETFDGVTASGPLATPGKGSAGGRGAPGCVLVYY